MVQDRHVQSDLSAANNAEARLRRLVSGMPHAERLPSERTLSAQWGVARMTLRKGIDRLEAEGLLARRQGAGTFTVSKPIIRALGLTSFSEDMAARGLTASTRLLRFERVAASTSGAAILGGSLDDTVLRLLRVRSADGEPIAVEETWLREDLVAGLREADIEGSLYEVLESRFGLRAARAETVIGASLLSPEDSDLLQAPAGSACLTVSLVDRLSDGTVFMLAECRYRADRYALSADLVHRLGS